MTKERIIIAISIIVGFIILSFTYYWVSTSDVREIKKFCHQENIINAKSGKREAAYDELVNIRRCIKGEASNCLDVDEKYKNSGAYKDKRIKPFNDWWEELIKEDYLECVMTKVLYMKKVGD